MRRTLFGVYGASGCGRGVLPLVRDRLVRERAPLDDLVFVDDLQHGRRVNGHRVLSYDEFIHESASEHCVVLAIANGSIRQQLAVRCEKDGVSFMQARASNVVEMDDVTIGAGAVLSPFVTLTSNIRIGRHFHANLYSYVEHDCLIGDFVTFAPGVQCNGNVHIEDCAYIGAGAILKQGTSGSPLVIGRGATIGMGAVVTRSVDPDTTVVGVPARPLAQFST